MRISGTLLAVIFTFIFIILHLSHATIDEGNKENVVNHCRGRNETERDIIGCENFETILLNKLNKKENESYEKDHENYLDNEEVYNFPVQEYKVQNETIVSDYNKLNPTSLPRKRLKELKKKLLNVKKFFSGKRKTKLPTNTLYSQFKNVCLPGESPDYELDIKVTPRWKTPKLHTTPQTSKKYDFEKEYLNHIKNFTPSTKVISQHKRKLLVHDEIPYFYRMQNYFNNYKITLDRLAGGCDCTDYVNVRKKYVSRCSKNTSENYEEEGAEPGTCKSQDMAASKYEKELASRIATQTISVQKMPGLLHEVNTAFKKATFGMGCFWAGESLYGAQKGVLRTRVGYASGTTQNPTYRKIGDHTEVVEIDYDPKTISYESLLHMFWNNHEYGLTKTQKKQYMSLILYHDDEQKQIAEKSRDDEAGRHKEPLRTEIIPAGVFYPAEDYHQKYRLQEHTWLVNQMGLTAEHLQTSHVATRLNGYVIGLGGMEQFNGEAEHLGLSDKMADYVRELLVKNEGGNMSC